MYYGMKEILRKLDLRNVNTETDCINIIDELEKWLNIIKSEIETIHMNSQIEERRANLVAFLNTATLAINRINESNILEVSLLDKLKKFMQKVFGALKDFAKSLEVETFSITVGFAVSITLTFKPFY